MIQWKKKLWTLFSHEAEAHAKLTFFLKVRTNPSLCGFNRGEGGFLFLRKNQQTPKIQSNLFRWFIAQLILDLFGNLTCTPSCYSEQSLSSNDETRRHQGPGTRQRYCPRNATKIKEDRILLAVLWGGLQDFLGINRVLATLNGISEDEPVTCSIKKNFVAFFRLINLVLAID